MSSQSLVGGEASQQFKIDKGSHLWRHTTRIAHCSGGGGSFENVIFASTMLNPKILIFS